jgi:hypothetical protein
MTIEGAIDRFIGRMGHITNARVHMDHAEADERNARPSCGNCRHWMKSRECPRERNVNGYSRGPSSGEPPCGKFTENARVQGLRDRAAEFRAKAAAELAAASR